MANEKQVDDNLVAQRKVTITIHIIDSDMLSMPHSLGAE